jgi:hypothetical protein
LKTYFILAKAGHFQSTIGHSFCSRILRREKITMSWTFRRESSLTILFFAAVTFAVGGALFLGVNEQPADAKSVAATSTSIVGGTSFPANSGPPAQCGTAGANKDVTFTVSGLAGSPTNVEVDMTFGSPLHTWRADVAATLIAPNGASHVIFGRTGATTATACGSSTDLTGPYSFFDASVNTNWWTVATNPTPPGDYRTTTMGGTAGGGAVTDMNPAFAGVADPNGTWTLRFTDAGGGDTGAVSAANLSITAGAGPGPVTSPVDFDGDGFTDWAVVQNTGGGPDGAVTWFWNLNAGGPTVGFRWGIASDFFVPEDYDGDGLTDIAVWRPGAEATFYIHNSDTNTVRIEQFGQTGDDPTVVGDYNNDGSADLAVYRDGATPGAQSTWFVRTAPGGPITFVPWGQNGDFPAPGDYDGDGSNDFVIQRGVGGIGFFWILRSSDSGTEVHQFGTDTDLIVPGDYDGDDTTDIAIVRGSGGAIQWWVRSSDTGAVSAVTFGASATDFPIQGDYDGDGRTDFAVWRDGAFWVLSSATLGVSNFTLGGAGDYPVANYNTH